LAAGFFSVSGEHNRKVKLIGYIKYSPKGDK